MAQGHSILNVFFVVSGCTTYLDLMERLRSYKPSIRDKYANRTVIRPGVCMSHKVTIHVLFDLMATEVASFIKEAEGGFDDGWVPATFIKDQLELKKSAYPQGNKIDNETGWLFATIARYLEDIGQVEFRKVGSRSFYKTI